MPMDMNRYSASLGIYLSSKPEYGEIGNYIYDECIKFFPESHYPSEEYTKYFEYFYGTYDKETKIDNNPFGNWVESIKKEFFT